MILQYIGSLEGDKKKLRAQVRRLADENSWLRQELQRTQQQLQEVESEACKIKEEKQHLEYTISLSKVVRIDKQVINQTIICRLQKWENYL